MKTYTCSKCSHKEQRSIEGWTCECKHCLSPMTTIPTNDHTLCSHCGTTHESYLRQCHCGNTMLTHYYSLEPDINSTIIQEIRQCISEGVTTEFRCTCGKSHAIYRTSQVNEFCHCGLLMAAESPDLLKFRINKRWTQALIASELNISERYYRELELKQRSPSAKLRIKIDNMMKRTNYPK